MKGIDVVVAALAPNPTRELSRGWSLRSVLARSTRGALHGMVTAMMLAAVGFRYRCRPLNA